MLHILNGDQIRHDLIHLMTSFSIEQVLQRPKLNLLGCTYMNDQISIGTSFVVELYYIQ